MKRESARRIPHAPHVLFATLLPILLVCIASSLRAEAVFGGKLTFSDETLFNTSNIWKSQYDWTGLFQPTLSVDGEGFHLSAGADIGYQSDPDSSIVNVSSLWLSTMLFDSLRIVVGKAPYQPGKAFYVSVNNFFSGFNYQGLLSGDLKDSFTNSDIVQASLLLPFMFIRGTVAPIMATGVAPDTTSPWFPTGDIPKTIQTYFPPPGRTLHLNSITIATPTAEPLTLQNLAAGAEIGGTIGPFDLSLQFFHGTDTTPVYTATIDLTDLVSPYDITITPVTSTINALGLSSEAVFDRLNVVGEMNYTFSKTFGTKKLSSTTLETETASSPAIQSDLGASYSFSWQQLTLSAEWRETWILSPNPYITHSLFDSMLFGGVSASFFDSILSLSPTVIVSPIDWSGAVLAIVSFHPTDALTLTASVPVFWGNNTSLLGQYAKNHAVFLTFSSAF